MSEQIVAALCPFCGEEPNTRAGFPLPRNMCTTETCPLFGQWIPAREWEKRPFEDALRQQLADITAYADKLAVGLPDGMLPQDVESMRRANWKLAQELKLTRDANAELAQQLAELQRKAVEQSEDMQTNWLSPIEVKGLKRQLAEAQSSLKLAQAEIDVLRKREAFGGWDMSSQRNNVKDKLSSQQKTRRRNDTKSY